MRFGRRHFLGISLVLGLTTQARALLASVVKRGRPRDDRVRALAPYLDTLIPADRWSPGASQLAIDRRLVEKAAGTPDYRRLLTRGCQELDLAARKLGTADFASLPEASRERLVTLLAAAAPGSPPRIFFETTRSDAVVHYYAHPESWAALGYNGPPQPAGFPDHDQPPGRAI